MCVLLYIYTYRCNQHVEQNALDQNDWPMREVQKKQHKARANIYLCEHCNPCKAHGPSVTVGKKTPQSEMNHRLVLMQRNTYAALKLGIQKYFSVCEHFQQRSSVFQKSQRAAWRPTLPRVWVSSSNISLFCLTKLSHHYYWGHFLSFNACYVPVTLLLSVMHACHAFKEIGCEKA